MIEEITFNTIENLTEQVENLVQELDIEYIDAVIMYCEKNGLDLEQIGDVISKSSSLKSKIEIEAEELHFIKKINRLPI